MQKNIIISPSILSSNHTNLINAVRVIESFNLKWLHLDIMDGNFVPNLSFGPQLVEDLNKSTNLFLDTHLMISHPENFISKFLSAGSDLITIHAEIASNKADMFFDIKQAGKQVGIAINPTTDVNDILSYIEYVDVVLIMCVQPGFGGQEFDQTAIEKIKFLKNLKEKHHLSFKIEVDGGIKISDLLMLINNGADIIVSGTTFFKNPEEFIENIL